MNWVTHEAAKYVVGNLSKSIQSLVDSLFASHFERCLIILHMPLPGTFLTRPRGDEQKGPLKMVKASDMVKGPDIFCAKTSASSSLSMSSGYKSAKYRLQERKTEVKGGGFPIGEL